MPIKYLQHDGRGQSLEKSQWHSMEAGPERAAPVDNETGGFSLIFHVALGADDGMPCWN